MAKPGPAQDQTMDEILASIRQMISDSDSPAAKLKAAVPRRPEPQPIAGNVSRLFVEPSDPKTEVKDVAPATEAGNVIDLVMAQAMEEARAEVEAEATAEFEEAKHAVEPVTASVPVAATSKPAPTAGRPDQPTPAPASAQAVTVQSGPPSTAADEARVPEVRTTPLLSAQADAAVAGAFDQLASTMLSRSGRMVVELVEDMLRPLLRNWLDDNLPPLVERLVREEIERVSRGRR
jgi:cell pole-organizing protein PopZ